jgi:hypothetical protein
MIRDAVLHRQLYLAWVLRDGEALIGVIAIATFLGSLFSGEDCNFMICDMSIG